ncbi:MAG: NUDIX domain-containing protein [Phycisphaerales bacterium JB040]
MSNPRSNAPVLRTDLVDVYVFRCTTRGVELLQLRRVDDDPDEPHSLHGTWQPVMGHLEGDERVEDAASRELLEETGLDVRSDACVRLFALEQVHPYYLPSRNAIMLSPRLACEVVPGWEPTLNDEHDASRWVPIDEADAHFMWPGQRACLAELRTLLAD